MKNKYLVLILFLFSLFPIFNMVFDYGEWDETTYTLSSFDIYHHHKYLKYTQLLEDQKNTKEIYVTYPNLLYMWSFGAFNSLFNLPTNHDSRLKFTLLLTFSLSLLLIIGYLKIFTLKYGDQHKMPKIGGIIFLILFIFVSSWKVRNAQLGAILFFSLAMCCLLLSHLNQKKETFFEILCFLLLMVSFYWKEQLIFILFVFPFFLKQGEKKSAYLYKILLFYVGLSFFMVLLYQITLYYSVHSGFDGLNYFYSKENKHWARQFNFMEWYKNASTTPMFIYFFVFLGTFIWTGSYKKIYILKNKMVFIALLHFFSTSIFYFFQGGSYISAINYTFPLLSFPFILQFFIQIDQKITKTSYKFLLCIVFLLPLLFQLKRSFSPTLGSTLLQTLTQPQAIKQIPCIKEGKQVALSDYKLTAIFLSDEERRRPIWEYGEITKKDFIKKLALYKPEMIIYRANLLSPTTDQFMKKALEEGEFIDSKGTHFIYFLSISSEVNLFIRQTNPQSLK